MEYIEANDMKKPQRRNADRIPAALIARIVAHLNAMAEESDSVLTDFKVSNWQREPGFTCGDIEVEANIGGFYHHIKFHDC